ncbi:MAG TPA: M1 family metallopeptidase [Pyrinomonadaceae bacterium]|nr:M1 family metallopeptidase [Pyrinomonadaceae bacterium]
MKKNTVKLMGRACSITALLLFAVGPLLAQRTERAVTTWRPLHYDIDIAFDDQITEFKSARAQIIVEVLAASLTKIDFDFGEMPIDSVVVSGEPARTERTAETLNVVLPHAATRGQKLDVTITYHGHPKDGMVFAKDRDGNQSATGDNWPNRVHYWIPSLDHPSAKASVSFTVSAPQRYEVIANGKFVTLTGNAATSHWKFDEPKPIPPYCMIITVNQGAIINSPDKSVTNLMFNVPQHDRDYAPKGFSPAAPALTYFSQVVAPYPYEKLALIVGATRFGGMENSSAIVFTSTLFDQKGSVSAPLGNANDNSSRFGIPQRIESVVAHEIAHQWFGDSVTESTWADLWLSEGFATYFAGLFVQKHDGEDAFRAYMNDAAQRYFTFEKQASFPIHDTETKDLMGMLNPNNYEKGAWVLHMLRMRLGDEAFFKGLRDYYNAHKEANATTEDLRTALEKSSGKDLKQFFARWIYGAGHPRYELQWGSMERRAATSVWLKLNQLQSGEAFLDPVPVEFVVNGKVEKTTIYPTAKSTTKMIRLTGNPTSVKIDPQGTLLKEVVSSQTANAKPRLFISRTCDTN